MDLRLCSVLLVNRCKILVLRSSFRPDMSGTCAFVPMTTQSPYCVWSSTIRGQNPEVNFPRGKAALSGKDGVLGVSWPPSWGKLAAPCLTAQGPMHSPCRQRHHPNPVTGPKLSMHVIVDSTICLPGLAAVRGISYRR